MHIKSGLVNPIFDMRRLMMWIIVPAVFMTMITGCKLYGYTVRVINNSCDTLLCVINGNPSDSLCPDIENPYVNAVLTSRPVYISERYSTSNLIAPSETGGTSLEEEDTSKDTFSAEKPYRYLLVYNWSEIKGLSYSEIRAGNYELSRRKISKADALPVSSQITLNFPADFELLKEVEVK